MGCPNCWLVDHLVANCSITCKDSSIFVKRHNLRVWVDVRELDEARCCVFSTRFLLADIWANIFGRVICAKELLAVGACVHHGCLDGWAVSLIDGLWLLFLLRLRVLHPPQLLHAPHCLEEGRCLEELLLLLRQLFVCLFDEIALEQLGLCDCLEKEAERLIAF